MNVRAGVVGDGVNLSALRVGEDRRRLNLAVEHLIVLHAFAEVVEDMAEKQSVCVPNPHRPERVDDEKRAARHAGERGGMIHLPALRRTRRAPSDSPHRFASLLVEARDFLAPVSARPPALAVDAGQHERLRGLGRDHRIKRIRSFDWHRHLIAPNFFRPVAAGEVRRLQGDGVAKLAPIIDWRAVRQQLLQREDRIPERRLALLDDHALHADV